MDWDLLFCGCPAIDVEPSRLRVAVGELQLRFRVEPRKQAARRAARYVEAMFYLSALS